MNEIKGKNKLKIKGTKNREGPKIRGTLKEKKERKRGRTGRSERCRGGNKRRI